MHIGRGQIKKSWKEFVKGNLKILGAFQGTFNLDSVVQGSKT